MISSNINLVKLLTHTIIISFLSSCASYQDSDLTIKICADLSTQHGASISELQNLLGNKYILTDHSLETEQSLNQLNVTNKLVPDNMPVIHMIVKSRFGKPFVIIDNLSEGSGDLAFSFFGSKDDKNKHYITEGFDQILSSKYNKEMQTDQIIFCVEQP